MALYGRSTGQMDPKRDPEHPSVAKVTIIYARNPEDYCLPAPPMHPDELELPEHEEERVRYLEEVGRAKLALKDGIRQHHALVKSLADFLCKYNVPVAHEQLTRDQGVDNLLKWVQKQVDDSDFVILVITPSLNVFLLERPPPEDEPLFVGDYLYNLINNRPPHLKGVLPVFINQVREHDIFPKSLEASTSYEIHQPFELDGSRQRSDDLHELYAVLTGQVLNPKPEACGVVKLRVQKKRFGQGLASRNKDMTPEQKLLFQRLCREETPITDDFILGLSSQSSFSARRKQLASKLGFSGADFEQFEADSRGDASETCFLMLTRWLQLESLKEEGGAGATVASLAKAVERSGCYSLLEDMDMESQRT